MTKTRMEKLVGGSEAEMLQVGLDLSSVLGDSKLTQAGQVFLVAGLLASMHVANTVEQPEVVQQIGDEALIMHLRSTLKRMRKGGDVDAGKLWDDIKKEGATQ